MWIGVISLFPEMFQALEVGITGRALKQKLLTLQIFNPRDYATDKHKSVDDHPYGGGPGMVMMAAPLKAAILAAKNAAPHPAIVIYLSPQGHQLNQEKLVELAGLEPNQSLIFIAGRYEGIDERIIQQEVTQEISIGDYVLSGGELAAMVVIDGMTRLIPGAIGDQDSVKTDSITSGLLKYPQYTRPEHFENLPVPKILLSGNHSDIERWRLQQSLGKTWLKRKDLLAKKHLNRDEQQLLDEYIKSTKPLE